MSSRLLRVVATAGTVFAAVAGGGYALATTAIPGAATAKPTYQCIKIGNPRIHYKEFRGVVPHACKQGFVLVGTGAPGATGPAGATGATGPAGPPGPPGPATMSVTGTTAITGRDDSGNGTGQCTASAANDCWATDTFTRIMTVTRNGAAPAGKCGQTATACWFYTATVADSGSFTTVPASPNPPQTPNQSCTEPNGTSCAGLQINGTLTGTLSGGGKLEFYASTDSPSTSGVPATATGDGPVSTTDWYKLFFPSGTQFGLTSASQAPWTNWSWTYTAPQTCESWTDSMATDGAGPYATVGNIAGINQCG